MNIKKILTIAGSDCSGGAGIQADLKTFSAHKTYGMSVITALTAQNTIGVSDIMEASAEFVAKQIDAIFQDIRPDAVKIGMVSNCEIIKVIADKLIEYKAENIVIDPVMVATSGSKLMSDNSINVLIDKLLPIGLVITPNIPEAEVLCGFKITDEEDMIKAAKKIYEKIKVNVLVKGGHLVNDAVDFLFDGDAGYWFKAERVDTNNTHGTGCTLSSAIACNLADGHSLDKSISLAKEYLVGAMKNDMNLGKGSGPLNHLFCIEKVAYGKEN